MKKTKNSSKVISDFLNDEDISELKFVKGREDIYYDVKHKDAWIDEVLKLYEIILDIGQLESVDYFSLYLAAMRVAGELSVVCDIEDDDSHQELKKWIDIRREEAKKNKKKSKKGGNGVKVEEKEDESCGHCNLCQETIGNIKSTNDNGRLKN